MSEKENPIVFWAIIYNYKMYFFNLKTLICIDPTKSMWSSSKNLEALGSLACERHFLWRTDQSQGQGHGQGQGQDQDQDQVVCEVTQDQSYKVIFFGE